MNLSVPLSPEEVRTLLAADQGALIIGQWLGWLLVIQITPPDERVSEPRLLTDAVPHILFLNHHYVDQEFFQAVQSELKQLARGGSSAR